MTPYRERSRSSDEPIRPTAYLAGPEVFLLNAQEIGERKKTVCNRYGMDAVFPLDVTPATTGTPSHADGHNQFTLCIELMNRCDLLLANMTPFRGVSMDVGTAVELGYMFALGRPVFGYTNVLDDYWDRVREYRRRGGSDDYNVERFGFADNLMCEGPIWQSNGAIIRHHVAADELFTNLDGFEECVRQAAQRRSWSATGAVELE